MAKSNNVASSKNDLRIRYNLIFYVLTEKWIKWGDHFFVFVEGEVTSLFEKSFGVAIRVVETKFGTF